MRVARRRRVDVVPRLAHAVALPEKHRDVKGLRLRVVLRRQLEAAGSAEDVGEEPADRRSRTAAAAETTCLRSRAAAWFM